LSISSTENLKANRREVKDFLFGKPGGKNRLASDAKDLLLLG
jgi:hypothetical protein